MIEVYDTFTRKSIEIVCPTKFLKEYGYYNAKNRQTITHFIKRTKFTLNRFIKKEFKYKIFTMYCIDDGKKYECVSSKGFLIQIGIDCNKKNIHEVNRLRCGGRTLIVFDKKTYVLYENKDKNHDFAICNRFYKESFLYHKNRKNQKIKRRISGNLRSRLRYAIKYNNNVKSESTLKLIGCSIDFLMGWLEKSFTDGMTWANYGKWHIDHIIPCVSFDLAQKENQEKCFHYTNLQPLWASDNFKKGKKIL